MNEQIPVVAIVGRPNVGKSTLFNRLSSSRQAIEADLPGTTRDRLYNEVTWGDKSLILVDTAGIFDLKKNVADDLNQQIKENVDEAIQEADLIVFVVDYNDSDNQLDQQIASTLRRSKKTVVVAVNQCDNRMRLKQIESFERFGNWPTVAVSALQHLNLDELSDQILALLKKDRKHLVVSKKDKLPSIGVAIVGRPNVGKSTLYNAFEGGIKRITSNQPGTTRDMSQKIVPYQSSRIKLFDTAGVVSSKKSGVGIEKFSLIRTLRAIHASDVCVLLMEVSEGVTALDKKIAGYVTENGKGIILVFNKQDLLVNEEQRQNLIRECQTEFNFLPYVPLIFISSLELENLKVIPKQVVLIQEQKKQIIKEEELSELALKMSSEFGQLPAIRSFFQISSNPPTFKIILKKKHRWHFTFSRFVENRIRDNFDFTGSPIKIVVENTISKN